MISDQPCEVHPSLGSQRWLPVMRVSGVAEIDKAELGLWFYLAVGCSDTAWYTGRTLLARNKQDALLQLASRWHCLRHHRRRRRRQHADTEESCAVTRPIALRVASHWLIRHGRAYAEELLNRSRHEPRFARYFEALAAQTVVEAGNAGRNGGASADGGVSADVSTSTFVGIRRDQLTLSALLDDAARGVGGQVFRTADGRATREGGGGGGTGGGRGEGGRGCNVHVDASSPTLCSGACAARVRALAFVHQREGLLDYVNLRLLQRLVGTAFELDTISLHHQPQGMYSLRTHAEMWDVRHLHSEYLPAVEGLRVKSRGGSSIARALSLVPFRLVNGSHCALWQGWRQCFACVDSMSQRACLTASRQGGREWYRDGARGLLAPASPSECGGLDSKWQTTDVCKAMRLDVLLDRMR